MDGFYLATTLQFAGNFAPRDWAFCAGQLTEISQNQALFAILGTHFGGDGRATFGLPDFRGRVPMGYGDGPGLPGNTIGQRFGVPEHTLSHSQLPIHNHAAEFTPTGSSAPISATATVNAGTGSDASDPSGKYWGVTKNGLAALNGYSDDSGQTMASDAIDISVSGGGITGGSVTIGNAGGSAPFGLYQPSTVIPFIICIAGLFPSRS